MDVTRERELFTATAARVPGTAIQKALTTEFERIATAYGAASTANDTAKMTALDNELAQLRLDANRAITGRAALPGNFYLLVGFVVALCFLMVWAYFYAIGAENYDNIGLTRPILVFTLIISMLGFGGVLIFRSQFTDEPPEEFERRFRLGREIFLVYSGIFGTIIGFYFGAASGEEAAAKPPTLSGLVIQADGLLSAEIQDGSAPFTGTFRLAGADEDLSLVISGDELSIQLTPDKDCPAGGKFSVRDSNSKTAELDVGETAQSLVDQGWTGCADEAAAAAAEGGNNATQAADTNQAAANETN